MTPHLKLISTDFDGTLFAEFEMPPIPPSIVSLIGDLQAHGAKWVINTGRDMSSLMESLGRAHIPIQPDYLVLVEREIHCHDGIRYAVLDDWNSACKRDHAELFVRVRPHVKELMRWIHASFSATVYEDDYSPFCLIAENVNDADEIHDYLTEFAGRVPNLSVVRNDIYTRFSHDGYNKGTAMAEIARRLGITTDEVFAAGDHLNDLPMLSLDYARWLAAPDNAVPLVKEAVLRQKGFVSSRSHGDGIAEGLKAALEKK